MILTANPNLEKFTGSWPPQLFWNAYNFYNSFPIDPEPVSNPTNTAMPVPMNRITSHELSRIHSMQYYWILNSL